VVDEAFGALVGIDVGKSRLIVIDADLHGGPDGVAELTKFSATFVRPDARPPRRRSMAGICISSSQTTSASAIRQERRRPATTLAVMADTSSRPDRTGWSSMAGTPDLTEAVSNDTVPPLPEILLRPIHTKPNRAERSESAAQYPSSGPRATGAVSGREFACARAAPTISFRSTRP
jgi:hypothetical protein